MKYQYKQISISMFVPELLFIALSLNPKRINFKGNWFEKVVSKCALLESTFFVTSYANFYIVRSMILQIKIVRKYVLWQFMSGWEIKFVIESLQFEFSLKSNININVPKVSNFLIFFVISWEFMLNRMNLRSLSNFFLLYLNIDS